MCVKFVSSRSYPSSFILLSKDRRTDQWTIPTQDSKYICSTQKSRLGGIPRHDTYGMTNLINVATEKCSSYQNFAKIYKITYRPMNENIAGDLLVGYFPDNLNIECDVCLIIADIVMILLCLMTSIRSPIETFKRK